MENEQLASEAAAGVIYQPWIGSQRPELAPQTFFALKCGVNYKGSEVLLWLRMRQTPLLAGVQEPSQMIRLAGAPDGRGMCCQLVRPSLGSSGESLPWLLQPCLCQDVIPLLASDLFLTLQHPGLPCLPALALLYPKNLLPPCPGHLLTASREQFAAVMFSF